MVIFYYSPMNVPGTPIEGMVLGLLSVFMA
jgi:hypothetical protein